MQLFNREQAHALGLSDRQVDRRLDSGDLIAVRRGVLRWADEFAPEATDRQSEPSLKSGGLPLDVKAALLAAPSRELVISHSCAARLYGLPKPLSGWPLPQFTCGNGCTRRRRGLHILVSSLADEDVVVRRGIPMTSPARTVADCLRTMPGRDALAVADAALRRNLTSSHEILEVLQRQAGWRNVSLARQIFALMDGRRESPLESWSAWAFAHTGVPAPQWQVDIREPDGLFLGRADCWWPGGVIGEADGRSKYALSAAACSSDAGALFAVLQAERRREQRMRDAGADVVRWSSGEVLKISAARQLSRRINAAITAALDAARFTGVIAQPILPPATDERPWGPTDGG